ncbi:unnamed protein product [Heterobilharzia americana]|nr:unnamed protein product [Heterobilharzia americana]
MIQGRTIGSTREGLLTSKFAVQSSQDVYRIMGKHKVNKQKILSVDDGFKNSACATENLLEPLRSKVHKQQNDPTSINHTDHNQSTDKMNVLNHSDKNQKRKRKHSSLYDAQNEDTLGDQDIFQNINVFESQVDKTVISKKLPKSKKRKKQHSSQLNVSNESTSTESNRIELIDDTEIKLKSGKLKRKHSSVKNGEDENSFKDHNASNESSEVNCEVEVVPKSKKTKT